MNMLVVALIAIVTIYVVWCWYEFVHAIEIDDIGNLVMKWEKDEFEAEHDEAIEFRKSPSQTS